MHHYPLKHIRCHQLSLRAIGGYTHNPTDLDVFGINLNNLIAEAISQPFTCSPLPQIDWISLSETPYERSAALALNGALLAIGGKEEGSTTLTVCLYRPKSNSWIKIEGMPIREREQCACTILPCGKVFIIGGDTQQVHIGTITITDTD